MTITLVSILALLVSLLALHRAWRDHQTYGRKISTLERQLADAKRLLRLRGDLANEIAHEIKNPISAILCSAEALEMLVGDRVGEDNRKSLQFIRQYGESLLGLVSDFLDVSTAESGNLVPKKQVVSLNEVVRSTVGLLESHAYGRRVHLAAFAPEEDISVFADPKHIKQIVFNLTHNALKFTDEEGEVHIHVECDFPDPFAKITVNDNGIGIPAENLSRLFELYERYDREGLEVEVGVGLGLALVKNLVELNGGSISVRSQPGVGTSFEILLPLVVAEDGDFRFRSSVQEVEPEKSLEGLTFLVIADDTPMRESLRQLLLGRGGRVSLADNPSDGVRWIQSHPTDILLVDDDLPGLSGLNFAGMISDVLGEQRPRCYLLQKKRKLTERDLEQVRGVEGVIEFPLNGRKIVDAVRSS